MDEIVGDELVGQQMNGLVVGGASLVPGIQGNAVSFDGIDACIDYGQHDICMSNAGLCNSGITWSMWLYIMSDTASTFLSSGCGYYRGETGFAFAIGKHGNLDVNVRSASEKWKYDFTIQAPLLQWIHFAVSWNQVELVKMYVNGTLQEGTLNAGNGYSHTTNPPINIGCSTGNKRHSNIIIDELLVWYDVKTPEFIIDLYSQKYIWVN